MRTASALLASLLLVLAGWLTPTAPAYACSIGSFGSPERHRAAVIESLPGATAVLVGTIVAEGEVGRVGDHVNYESVVATEALLAGEAVADLLVVQVAGYHSQTCSGGSRLREGEKVLLALVPGQDGRWQVHHFLGHTLLHEGEAVSRYANVAVAIGHAEDFVRIVGAAVDADSRQIDAAIAAMDAPAAAPSAELPIEFSGEPIEGSGNARWLAIAGVVFAVGLVAALVRSRASG